MPSQELYLEKKWGLDVFQVLKTYDTAFAKETFGGLDKAAMDHLSKSLSISEEFPPEMPISPADITDSIWEELYDSAREQGQTRSYFIVRRSSAFGEVFLYVSGDWPSAEAYVHLVAAN